MSITYTGASTPGAMMAYLGIAGTILTYARKPLTPLTVKETQLEGSQVKTAQLLNSFARTGQLRYVHSRLITNCEEVAFYQGNTREKLVLLNALNRLRNHLFDMSIFRFNIDFLDNLIARCND